MKQVIGLSNPRVLLCFLLAIFLVTSGCEARPRPVREVSDVDGASQEAQEARPSQEEPQPVPQLPEEEGGQGEESLEEIPQESSTSSRPMNPQLEEYVQNGDKLVALTFDDGPHHLHTVNLLEILEREDVKATFFLIGVHIERYPDVVPLLSGAGHQVGNHTVNHSRLTNLEEQERKSEIQDNAQVIEELTGYAPFGLRPPFGDLDDGVKEDANAPIIMWSVDPVDWKTHDAEVVSGYVIDNVEDGDIILMHDVYPTSVEAVEIIVPALKEAGFRFVTVDELIYAREGEPLNGTVYSSLRP